MMVLTLNYIVSQLKIATVFSSYLLNDEVDYSSSPLPFKHIRGGLSSARLRTVKAVALCKTASIIAQ